MGSSLVVASLRRRAADWRSRPMLQTRSSGPSCNRFCGNRLGLQSASDASDSHQATDSAMRRCSTSSAMRGEVWPRAQTSQSFMGSAGSPRRVASTARPWTYFDEIRSTSNTSVAFGGITPPAPRAP